MAWILKQSGGFFFSILFAKLLKHVRLCVLFGHGMLQMSLSEVTNLTFR